MQEEIESKNPTEADLNAQEQGEIEPVDNGITIPMEEEKTTKEDVSAPTEMVIPAEEKKQEKPKENVENTEMVIPMDEPTAPKTEPQKVEPKKQQKPTKKKEEKAVPIDDNSFVIPVEPEPTVPQTTFEVPIDEPKAQPKKAKTGSKKQATTEKKTTEKKEETKKQTLDGPNIYFSDDSKKDENKEKKQENQTTLDYDFEDEYYDLDGF